MSAKRFYCTPSDVSSGRYCHNCLSPWSTFLFFFKIAAIANALCHDVYFKSLELDDLQLGDEGAIMFSRALSINAVVTAVNLSSNNIRNSGLASVGTMLKANTSLRELSLAWNSLGVLEDGCSHIAEVRFRPVIRRRSLQQPAFSLILTFPFT